MVRQVSPGRLLSIKIGAAISYIIVLIFGLWTIQSVVCDISRIKDRVPALFGILSVSVVVPWLYTLVIDWEWIRSERRNYSQANSRNIEIVELVDSLEESLSQASLDSSQIGELFRQLRLQVDDLSMSEDIDPSRYSDLVDLLKPGILNNFRRNKIVERAVKIGLRKDYFPLYVSRKRKKEVIDGFKRDILNCIDRVSESLECCGVRKDVLDLKGSFKIQPDVEPYVLALRYIRDYEIPKLCKNSWQEEEISTYFTFLIDDISCVSND